jgi:hypothetical protein
MKEELLPCKLKRFKTVCQSLKDFDKDLTLQEIVKDLTCVSKGSAKDPDEKTFLFPSSFFVKEPSIIPGSSHTSTPAPPHDCTSLGF